PAWTARSGSVWTASCAPVRTGVTGTMSVICCPSTYPTNACQLAVRLSHRRRPLPSFDLCQVSGAKRVIRATFAMAPTYNRADKSINQTGGHMGNIVNAGDHLDLVSEEDVIGK